MKTIELVSEGSVSFRLREDITVPDDVDEDSVRAMRQDRWMQAMAVGEMELLTRLQATGATVEGEVNIMGAKRGIGG